MSDNVQQQLAQLSLRLERMALEPEQIEAPWSLRLTRPFYRWAGWQPEMRITASRALLAELRDDKPAESGDQGQSLDGHEALKRALEELEHNVRLAERATMINGRITIAQHAWLTRLIKVLAQAARVIEGEGGAEVAAAAAFDPVFIAPPLAVASAPDTTPVPGAAAKSDAAAQSGEHQKSGAQHEPADPRASNHPARLLQMQLSAIDHIIEAARAESAFLDRRRRLLEAARRLLLDADAALRLDPEGVRLRKRYLAQQIVHLDRVQAAGVSPHVSLLHQAKSAHARGQRARLYATLVAMEGFAVAASDHRLAALSSKAISQLSHSANSASQALDSNSPRSTNPPLDSDSANAEIPALDSNSVHPSPHTLSYERSVGEIFGQEVLSTIAEARTKAHEQLSQRSSTDPETARLALEYLAPDAESATFSALLSVDGCFDVGAPLAPVRISQHETIARVVPYPTQELILTPARGPEDIASATIADPRSIMLDLAAGRLLSRKFVQYEQRMREQVKMVGEVRVYLLDGSTSMMTDGEQSARARMRDAILTAELATLLRRLRYPEQHTRVLLYYRYFTRRIWPLHRIATPDEALAAIGDVVSRQWQGGTDIEQALSSCFEMIRDAAASDPELARAQVVLITDGKAQVREQLIAEARGQLGELPVFVSVIALGQENETLRQLVARQRTRGERAFYHFIDDETLLALCNDQWQGTRPLHLIKPEDAEPWSRADLRDAMTEVLEEASDLERKRHRLLLQPPPDLEAAFAEVGLSPEMLSEGQRAQHEAAERDRRAVTRRYRRWFPELPAHHEPMPMTGSESDEDAAVLVLSTVAEVIGELGGGPLVRKADAIDVLERLLADARLSPGHYRELVSEPTTRIAHALRTVNALTAG